MKPSILKEMELLQTTRMVGHVHSIVGLLVEVSGLEGHVKIGDRVDIEDKTPCEVIGFKDGRTLIMPYTSVEGLAPGALVATSYKHLAVAPNDQWLGRIVNGLGEAIDLGAPLPHGPKLYPLRAAPPPAHKRMRVGARIDVGIRAINTFATICAGQRMGIFAGSGVGKSVLLSQLARFTDCDVAIIGLIGERGREVREFIEDNLGEEGLKRSIVVVATSDESALLRRQAAYTAMALSEYFRDQGKRVLCLMDSITRFASAQREIGLSAGEPPTTKGYPPTVFSELPRLLERSGPGEGDGSITGIFTVLVDGDDHNEPIADAARSILDGHIVLDRKIAERGQYPAINVLKSISRMMPHCNGDLEGRLIKEARKSLSDYEDMAEMIRLGAYSKGSSEDVDQAIELHGPLLKFLSQGIQEKSSFDESFQSLESILKG